jgi:hypothetical protein
LTQLAVLAIWNIAWEYHMVVHLMQQRLTTGVGHGR